MIPLLERFSHRAATAVVFSFSRNAAAAVVVRTLHATGWACTGTNAPLHASLPNHLNASLSRVLVDLDALLREHRPAETNLAPIAVLLEQVSPGGLQPSTLVKLFELGGRVLHSDRENAEARELLCSLGTHVDASTGRFTAPELSASIAALRRIPRGSRLRLLDCFIRPLSECTETFEVPVLLRLLEGLDDLPSGDPAVAATVALLARKAVACRPGAPVSSADVASMLWGMRAFTDVSPVRRLLLALTPLLGACSDTLTPQEMASLSGLRGLSSNSPEVCAYLREVVVPRLPSDCPPVKAAVAVTALSGLRSMCASAPEVGAAVEAVTIMLRAAPRPLDNSEVARALSSCTSFSSETPAVRTLVAELARHLEMNGDLSFRRAVDASSALRGCMGLSSEVFETRALLAALAPRVTACTDSFSPRALSLAYSGLQRCDSRHAEVVAVLAALAPKLSRFAATRQPMDAPSLGRMLCGLQRSRPSLDNSALHWALAESRICVRDVKSLPTPAVLGLAQGCATLLDRASSMSLDLSCKEAEALEASFITPVYSACVAELDRRPPEEAQRSHEARLQETAAQVVLALGRVELSGALRCRPTAQHLHGYSADIVIEIAPGALGRSLTASPVTLNVELDGTAHLSLKKRRHCWLRDRHLARAGVIVLRWDILGAQVDDDRATTPPTDTDITAKVHDDSSFVTFVRWAVRATAAGAVWARRPPRNWMSGRPHWGSADRPPQQAENRLFRVAEASDETGLLADTASTLPVEAPFCTGDDDMMRSRHARTCTNSAPETAGRGAVKSSERLWSLLDDSD